MDMVKTTVVYHLPTIFPESVAFDIASFLVEDPAGNRAKEYYKALVASLYGASKKGKTSKSPRYGKNLRYDSFFVYSYGTHVIQLNWENRTAKRLGRWSPTTTRHMNYAIHMLSICYDFTEVQ